MKPIFKYRLITYGCQMNKSDSERIVGLLQSLGGQAAKSLKEADLIILNTCSVRQSAEDRVFGQVHNLAQLKKTKPQLVIAVTGCLPGRDKKNELRKKMPGVDLYFPIIDLPKLPQMLSQIFNIQYFNIFDKNALNDNYLKIPPSYTNHFQAFVPIQTGCNNFCSYCVVPYARGQEKNRPLCQILREIRSLAAKGCLEITLLGQVVNNYQAPDPENFSAKNPYLKSRGSLAPPKAGLGMTSLSRSHFAALLWEINQIKGIQRLHFTAADPQFMSAEIIEAMALPRQVNYLHLPVQSGSNKILKKMNRHYTREDYLKIIKKIKEKNPLMALGTDIIVGFPGETEEDFQKTIELYKEANFDIAYLAQYSPRSGTAAWQLNDDVPAGQKEKRWWRLQKLMEEITLKKNQEYIGKKVEVLVDYSRAINGGNSKSLKKINRGQSREMKLVEFLSPESWAGKIVKVRVEKAEIWRLLGQLTTRT